MVPAVMAGPSGSGEDVIRRHTTAALTDGIAGRLESELAPDPA